MNTLWGDNYMLFKKQLLIHPVPNRETNLQISKIRFFSVTFLYVVAFILNSLFLCQGARAQSTSLSPAQVTRFLQTKIQQSVTASDWTNPAQQVNALLAAQRAVISIQTLRGYESSLSNSPVITSGRSTEVLNKVRATLWLQALLESIDKDNDLRYRIGLSQLALLSRSTLATLFTQSGFSATDAASAATSILAMTPNVQNGVFTGSYTALLSQYPRLPVALLGDTAQNSLALSKAFLQIASLSVTFPQDEIFLPIALGNPAQSPVGLPVTGLDGESNRTGAIVRALNLLSNSTITADPLLGIIGGPIVNAYKLLSVGVSDREAIQIAVINAPAKIATQLDTAKSGVFAQYGNSFNIIISDIVRARSNLISLGSFINLYARTDSAGNIGEVVSFSGVRRRFKNVDGLFGPQGALMLTVNEALHPPASVANPSPTPSQPSSGLPPPLPANSLTDFGLVSRALSDGSIEWKIPSAPAGQGRAIVRVPKEGPVRIARISAINGVDGSEIAVLREVLGHYQGREASMIIPPGTPSYATIVLALRNNPLIPNFNSFVLSAARTGGLSFGLEGNNIYVRQFPGEITYWKNRALLTAGTQSQSWLATWGIITPIAKTVSARATRERPRPQAIQDPPATSPSGRPSSDVGDDATAVDLPSATTRDPLQGLGDINSRPVPDEAHTIAQQIISAINSGSPSQFQDLVVKFDPLEQQLVTALQNKSQIPQAVAAQQQQLLVTIEQKISAAVQTQILGPLQSYLQDYGSYLKFNDPSLSPSKIAAQVATERKRLLDGGTIIRIITSAIEITYRNIRIPQQPYSYDRVAYQAAQDLVLGTSDSTMFGTTSDYWIYRSSRNYPGGHTAQRASLNVDITPEVIGALDKLISVYGLQVQYKFGSLASNNRAMGWLRNDSITIYFASDITPEALDLLSSVAKTYGRGRHDLVGQKVIDGLSISHEISAEEGTTLVRSLVEKAPLLGTAIKSYLTGSSGAFRGSEGQFEAVRRVAARYGVSITDGGSRGFDVVVQADAATGSILGGQVLDLGGGRAAAQQSFESISYKILAQRRAGSVFGDSARSTRVWDGLKNRFEFDGYTLPINYILNPDNIPAGSSELAEYSRYQSDYDDLRRRLLNIRDDINVASDTSIYALDSLLSNSEQRIRIVRGVAGRAYPEQQLIELGSSSLGFGNLVHEAIGVNLPKDLHLYNLVASTLGADGNLPKEIAPLWKGLVEILSIKGEFDGNISTKELLEILGSRYPEVYDTFVAINESHPELLPDIRDSSKFSELVAQLQQLLVERTTRPIADLLSRYQNQGVSDSAFVSGIADFIERAKWSTQVVTTIRNMSAADVSKLFRSASITALNAIAHDGGNYSYFHESFVQKLTSSGPIVDRIKSINNVIATRQAALASLPYASALPKSITDPFWTGFKNNNVSEGWAIQFMGPSNVGFSLRESETVQGVEAIKRWPAELTFEGLTYKGEYILTFEVVTKRSGIPPNYSLKFSSPEIPIVAKGFSDSRFSEMPMIRDPKWFGQATITLDQFTPVTPTELVAAERAVLSGDFTPRDAALVKGSRIRPPKSDKLSSAVDPLGNLLGSDFTMFGQGRFDTNSLDSFPSELRVFDAPLIDEIAPRVAALGAERGLSYGGTTASGTGLSSGLFATSGWNAASLAELDKFDAATFAAVLRDPALFTEMSRYAQRGEVAALATFRQRVSDMTRPENFLTRIFPDGLFTSVPLREGVSGDLGLLTHIREILIRSPDLTATQQWVIDQSLQEMMASHLTDIERTNLVKFLEHVRKGGVLSIPEQLFGGGTTSAREIIARIAYTNWAGGSNHAAWQDPLRMEKLLFEANFVALNCGATPAYNQALQDALNRTRGEFGSIGERVSLDVAPRVDGFNPADSYSFLSNAISSDRSISTLQNLAGRFTPVSARPSVISNTYWDPVVRIGGKTSLPNPNARGTLQVYDRSGTLLSTREIGPDFNIRALDPTAFEVHILNYNNNPLYPDLVGATDAAVGSPVSRWVNQNAPQISALQARAEYAGAQASELIVTEGKSPIPSDLTQSFSLPEVREGIQPGRGEFTEVVLRREPTPSSGSDAFTFKKRFDSLVNVDGRVDLPPTTVANADRFDINLVREPARISIPARAMKGALTGAGLILNFTAWDTAVVGYFQGESLPQASIDAAKATVQMYKDPTFWELTGLQAGIDAAGAAAAGSSIPWIATGGEAAAPVAMTAMAGFGLTTMALNIGFYANHSTPARVEAAANPLTAPFLQVAIGSHAIYETVSSQIILPLMLSGSKIDREAIKNDPYMTEFLLEADKMTPGEALASFFGATGADPTGPTVNDALAYIEQANEKSPFLYEGQTGDELVEMAQQLVGVPEKDWKTRIDFRREIYGATAGDLGRDLVKFLPFNERAGLTKGTNDPDISWLSSLNVNSSTGTLGSKPLYLTPKTDRVDASQFKILSLDGVNNPTIYKTDPEAQAVDQAVESISDPHALGSAMRFSAAEGASVSQYVDQQDQPETPATPEWWSPSWEQTPPGYDPSAWYQQGEEQAFKDAASGVASSSTDIPTWDQGDPGYIQNGITIGGTCLDPLTGQMVAC